MPRFEYKARDPQGQSRAGMLEAPSESDALRKLRADGLTVTDIRLASGLVDVERVRTHHASRTVNRAEVIAFASQLGVMLETGVPVSEALGAFLAQSKQGSGLRRVVESVADRINSGVSFSAAVAEFPRVFPSLMVNLLRASEVTGGLGAMLSRISQYLGAERAAVRKIRSALTYPAIMLSMACIVTVFLVAWVLPRFAAIYESRAAALPTPTRMLLDVSDAITANWIVILVTLVAVSAGLTIAARTRRGARAIDLLKIKTPVIGPIFTSFYLTRAARTLSTLLGSGVTLPESIDIVRGVTDNHHWRRMWDGVQSSMTQGRTMTEVITATELIPPSVAQMIAAGERTGRLPSVLDRIATITQEDLDDAIKSSTQLIEPIVITVMGAMIGGIAVALLLPIFTMSRVMAG